MKTEGLLAIWAACIVCGAQAVDIDGIAATVGGASILNSEVRGEMHRIGADPNDDYNAVLNKLIERKLILAAAATSKMTMQEWIVDNRIREIVERGFNGDRNQLIAALAREKLPYTEFRQKIKDDLIVGAMRWNVVDKYVTASPAEMREEYAAHPERYLSKALVSVSVILLSPGEAEKKELVDDALKEDPFADVARRYSAGPHAKDGGAWKDVQPQEVFLPEICETIAKLQEGEVSPWVDLNGWSFLVKKDKDTVPAPRAFADAYDDIEANVRARRGKELYNRWLDMLKAETYIKVFE